MMERIAILASGEGTTTEAFIRTARLYEMDIEVGLVISNNPEPGVFKRVEQLNQEDGLDIPVEYISAETHPQGAGDKGEQTISESEAILEKINEKDIGLVLLLGYMRKVRGPLLECGPTILNTHPGPLPQTAGMHDGLAIQEYVLKSRLDCSAQTLHVVDEGYDTGSLVATNKVIVSEHDTPPLLYEKVRGTEKRCLPFDVQDYISSRT